MQAHRIATEYAEITYDVRDRIATIALNRPAARNGYTVLMSDELADAFVRADNDDDAQVVVLTGTGETFCVGGDLSGGTWDIDEAKANIDTWQEPAGRCAKAIYAMNKPVIAAIRGAAVGAGSTIILPCDFRLAGTDSRFGFVFSRRGIFPEGGSTWFLPRLVGLGRAADWMISGRTFGAEEALEAGLVHRLCDPEDVLENAYALARELIATTAPVATGVIRQMLLHLSGQASPELAFRVDSRLTAGITESPDAIEGIMSFLQKRSPTFTGTVGEDIPGWLPWRQPSGQLSSPTDGPTEGQPS